MLTNSNFDGLAIQKKGILLLKGDCLGEIVNFVRSYIVEAFLFCAGVAFAANSCDPTLYDDWEV